jgi:hypothetical protein
MISDNDHHDLSIYRAPQEMLSIAAVEYYGRLVLATPPFAHLQVWWKLRLRLVDRDVVTARTHQLCVYWFYKGTIPLVRSHPSGPNRSTTVLMGCVRLRLWCSIRKWPVV